MELNEKKLLDDIKKELSNINLKEEEIGKVVNIGNDVVELIGLNNVMANEMIQFDDGSMGMCLNLEENSVKAILLDKDANIKEGSIAKKTGNLLSIPVGDEFIGRIVDPLGNPIDNLGPIKSSKRSTIERHAPEIYKRQPVRVPLETGIKSIDSMIPIGRGQRELIIGDRQTGKTSIAIDTIINQKGKDIICVYVSIGQKLFKTLTIYEKLKKHGAMDYTIMVVASASDPASFLYIAPYSGCALAEYFTYEKRHSLCIYDDLTKHANAYREISLLLERPPGREAFPGDVFYIHSRLLERAVKLSNEFGGGSLTALPIVETQEGEVSSYIPTNVISITDGQIYLDSKLFALNIKPAINLGISVSRVGGNAQIPSMKFITGSLRLEMSQYKSKESFIQFSDDLDESTKKEVERGKRLVEVLKQKNFSPLSMEKQILIFYCCINNLINHVSINDIELFESKLFEYFENNDNQFLNSMLSKDFILSNKKEIREKINNFITFFLSQKDR